MFPAGWAAAKTLLAVPIVVGGARIIASAGDSPWAQYGILGAVVAGLVVTQSIVPGPIYKDVRAERDEARAENKALVQQIIDNQQVALPALQQASSVLQQAMPIIQDALRVRDQRGGGG